MQSSSASTQIPKLLHYVWVGGTPIPARFRRNIRSWQRHNPDFELRLWNESNIDWSEPFIREAHRQRAWAKLSDYIRLRAVEREGGIYLDTDVEVVRPLHDLLGCECFVGIQSGRAEDDPVCNAVFGAVPQHPFIRRVLAAFPATTTDDLYGVGTGPELLSALLLADGLEPGCTRGVRIAGVDVLPPAAFYPYHWLEEFSPACVTPETFAIHHWDMSWHHAKASAPMRMLRHLVKTYPQLYRPLKRLYRTLRQSLPPRNATS